ncbi:MAG: YqgE/AlgH family protein [Orrella sp.]
MNATVDLSGHFLMAMPGSVEGDLAGTVIYVCEHSDQGALGLVINRPMDLTISHLLQKVDLEAPDAQESADQIESDSKDSSDFPVFYGGPVQTDRGFVLHKPAGEFTSSIHLGKSMALTTSKDVLQAVAGGEGPEQILVTLGYAGWGAGQLEQELAQNAWLSVAAEETIIFDEPPESRYPAAMRLLGIDPAMLAGSAGHA